MRSDIKIYHFDEIYLILPRTVERYQRGNQNQKDKQNTSQKTKDRATRTSLKPRDECRLFGRVCISCSSSSTRRVTVL